jgi:hypothetical protein
MTATDRDAIVSAWSQADAASAVLPEDRAAIAQSAGVRALVVDLLTSGADRDDVFDACAVLGRLVAQHRGSPTLAASTIDHAAEALSARGATWVEPARAALVEAFAADAVSQAVAEALRTWEFPQCAVPLGPGTIAVAAGYPCDDREALVAWAARVAQAAALQGVRQATIAGSEPARRALAEAFATVGVHVTTR